MVDMILGLRMSWMKGKVVVDAAADFSYVEEE
jgi:hypothetical protein